MLILPLLVIACYNRQAQQIELLRAPYLQTVLADSVTILWRTDIGSQSEVKFRESGESQWKSQIGSVAVTNTKVIENEVTIKGLPANQSYEYQIITNEQRLGDEVYTFHSAKDSNSDRISLFAVGDIGSSIEEEGTPHLLGASLEKELGSVDLGLLLGDIVYRDGAKERYDTNFFQYFDRVFPFIPVYPVLGNHDWGMFRAIPDYINEWKLPNNEHYYSFNYGKVHFIALDSRKGLFYDYERQKEWLINDLKNKPSTTEWTVVFLHHNGKSCTYKEDTKNVVALYPIFEEYGIDLVLNGHAHTYERLFPMNGGGEVVSHESNNRFDDPKGFVSITVGSGGILRGRGQDPKAFTPDPDKCRHEGLVAAYSHNNIYLKIAIDGNELKGQAMTTVDQTRVDEFVISKKGSEL